MNLREEISRGKARQKLSPYEKCGCRKPELLDELAELEQRHWTDRVAALMASGAPLGMPTKPAQLLSGDIGAVPIGDPFGFLEVAGHSGMADANGVTIPDFGPAHVIDQGLQPANYRSIAMGSAIASWHNQGNGTNGDGGWAQVATEFPRQEDIAGYNQTTLNGATLANAASIIVTSAAGIAPLEFLVVGKGSTCEVVQVSGTYAGGATVALQANCVNAHSNLDPVYHAPRNAGGYLAKSSAVIVDFGGNDLPYLGPRNTVALDAKVFGTNPGAARGLDPYKHALRFMLAVIRCSQIYQSTHPATTFAGTWANGSLTSAFAYASTASWPPVANFGGGNTGTYLYSTANASTTTFTTDPDFPGGTVDFFSMSYYNPSGSGCVWSFGVTGATTQTLTNVFDTRNINAVNFNDAAGQTTAKCTGAVYRITGLNPGVNTIVATISSLVNYGVCLGWGIEAPLPPYIAVPLQFRLGGFNSAYGYGVWYTQPYYRRTFAGAQTATVTGGQGTGAGSVTLGSAVTIGTTGTTNAAVYPGDTITIGTGGTQETRRVVAVASTTTLSVDANFTNTHTGEACIIGYQDADFVGGGYVNTADTQGAASVPGLNSVTKAVCAEFDQYVQTIDFDPIVNPPGRGSAVPAFPNSNLANDGVHFSNKGAAEAAIATLKVFQNSSMVGTTLSKYKVSNRRYFTPVYGEASPAGQPAFGAGAQAVFYNSWQNSFPTTGRMRMGFYKDSKTREVTVKGSITGGTDNYITILPLGSRPQPNEGRGFLFGWGSAGSVVLVVNYDGTISWAMGYPGATGTADFYGKFLAEYP